MRCFFFSAIWWFCPVPRFPSKQPNYCLVWDFLREVNENCVLLGCYATSNDDFLPTFWDNLSFPSSRRSSRPLEMRTISCTETSVRNFQYWLRKSPEERSSNHTVFGDLRLCQLRWRRFNCSEIEERVNRQRFIGVTKKVGVFILVVKQSEEECDLEIKLRTKLSYKITIS